MNKKLIIFTIIYILLMLVFYSYSIITTWDSSEYLGLADFIGTPEMKSNWISHRGIGFPLLLKLGKLIRMKTLLFIFYLITCIFLFMTHEKLKEKNVISKSFSIFFAVYCIFALLLHPIIFAYFHKLLTEFVAITFALITIYLSWNFIDFSWKKDKKKFCIYTLLFALIVSFIYQVKQSLTPIVVVPITVSCFFSLLHKFDKETILSRALSIAFIIVIFVLNLFAWKFFMGNEVLEATYNARLKPITNFEDTISRNLFKDYLDILEIDNKVFWCYKENFTIGTRIYSMNARTYIDINPDYLSYIIPYATTIKPNLVNSIFNYYLSYVFIFMMCATKILLLLVPFILVALCVFYLFIMKKIPKNVLSLYQLTIILYATTFFGIFAYVLFRALIDRYTVPLMFTGILAYLILTLLIINLVKLKSTLKLPSPKNNDK